MKGYCAYKNGTCRYKQFYDMLNGELDQDKTKCYHCGEVMDRSKWSDHLIEKHRIDKPK